MKNKTWITNDVIELLVSKELPILEGFHIGRLFHKHDLTQGAREKKSNLLKARMTGSKLPEEIKRKISEALKYGENRTSDTRWMHKGEVNKRIHLKDIPQYQAEGWDLGKIGKNKSCSENRKRAIGNANKGRIYINNGKITKFIKPIELDQYINSGWILGRLKKGNTKNE